MMKIPNHRPLITLHSFIAASAAVVCHSLKSVRPTLLHTVAEQGDDVYSSCSSVSPQRIERIEENNRSDDKDPDDVIRKDR